MLTLARLTLPPMPRSVGEARTGVTHALAARPDLVDAARLAVSELATNAVVHARTPFTVAVLAEGAGVRIEVEDSSSILPHPRHYDTMASTGRGLPLVATLSSEFGVYPTERGGKVVWFTLDESPVASPEQMERGVPEGVSQVQLVGLPVALYCTLQQHLDAVLRECMLLSFDPEREAPITLSQELDGALTGMEQLSQIGEQAFPLLEQGVRSASLNVKVLEAHLSTLDALQLVSELTADAALKGYLLVPPSQPELNRVLEWCCSEIMAQCGGRAPTPWISESPGEEQIWVEPYEGMQRWVGTSHAVIVADATNRIIGVSEAASSLLGWSVGELQGRRLVSIIPHSHRDAHVAGFVRHLLTGEDRIVGSEVELPAIRMDGSEIRVRLKVSTVGTPRGRVYVGSLKLIQDDFS